MNFEHGFDLQEHIDLTLQLPLLAGLIIDVPNNCVVLLDHPVVVIFIIPSSIAFEKVSVPFLASFVLCELNLKIMTLWLLLLKFLHILIILFLNVDPTL